MYPSIAQSVARDDAVPPGSGILWGLAVPRMHTPRLMWIASVALLPLAFAQRPDGLEHFERFVRPLLAERCYACHSGGNVVMGGLELDSKEGVLRGGGRGPAIRPGDPGGSLLVRAISYESVDLRMPPTGKLSAEEVARIEEWISMGAPDPRHSEAVVEEPAPDLLDGRDFWSFRPVGRPEPPPVRNGQWARTGTDRFILAGLEEAGLRPPAEADRGTLLRRVTFDLTGLPPSPRDIERFKADTAPGAFERVVDRLLESPHYGERWGRHWLDLVRWAETNGHEFDNNKLDAWRYRDYVIEAFNADLPYDRFVAEQIAGDLLPPRMSADGSHFSSPIASGAYWLWEVLNSPTDSVKARADQVDNQIDVLFKATQGLTVACARCHDHKFDPIPTADYYSIFGILSSTHMAEVCIDSPARARQIAEAAGRVQALDASIGGLLEPGRARSASGLAGRLMAAAREIGAEAAGPLADELGSALDEPSHPLHPFARVATELSAADPSPFSEVLAGIRSEMDGWLARGDRRHALWKERDDTIFEDFENGFGQWTVSGAAFGDAPVRSAPPSVALAGHAGQSLAASFAAKSLTGSLTTEKFRMPARFVHVRMAGPQYGRGLKEDAPARVTVIADEHKSGHAMPDGSGRLQWHTIAMTKERGRICAIEIVDRDRETGLAVDQIVFSSSPEPPPIAGEVDPRIAALLDQGSLGSLGDLAEAYEALAADLGRRGGRDPRERALLSGLLGHVRAEDARDHLDPQALELFRELSARRDEADRAVPPSTYAMTSRDWQPADSPIHLRGNHKTPGRLAPRQFLQVVAGTAQEPVRDGSGRLELARWVASQDNPLTPRVMANRVWHHHFGTGIVASTDNFGRMGQAPSHPELLDFLAGHLVDSGWSVKALHREIVHSSAYRATSEPPSGAPAVDPSNRLLSHFPVRRLEAEAIRDSVLAVSGSIDLAVGGPGIAPHISVYQDGRGKPRSGPLDGLGRRSVYLQVRRNFLPPLFLAFDYPLPISTEGRRGVSAVASQALLMLNNEFVNEQARLWADRSLRAEAAPDERIRNMYLTAFGRPPADSETGDILAFISDRERAHGGDHRRAWADLAHALFNTAEFLFVR